MELWFVLLENTGSCCFSMARGALGTLLRAGSPEEEAPFLHSTWSYSLTESKNFWFCGCCSLVLMQWAPPHSPAWNVLGEVLADLFRCAFSQQRRVCLFCEGILCGSSPEAMDIVSLISIRILQNLHLALGTHCSHWFEPTWAFLGICNLCLQLYYVQPSSTYFGASPLCWKLPTGANDIGKQAGSNWITDPFSCRWGTSGPVRRCAGCPKVD